MLVSGPKLREEMAAAVSALQQLSEAVAMELKVLVPTTVDRLMSHFTFSRTHKKVAPELPDAVRLDLESRSSPRGVSCSRLPFAPYGFRAVQSDMWAFREFSSAQMFHGTHVTG